jgi:hypothetical protein
LVLLGEARLLERPAVQFRLAAYDDFRQRGLSPNGILLDEPAGTGALEEIRSDGRAERTYAVCRNHKHQNVTHADSAHIGGRQRAAQAHEPDVVVFGEGGPSAEEVAAAAGTISYEITCGVSARVPRVV